MNNCDSASNESLENEYPTHEEIAACAYLAWEQAGRPEGRSEEFWHQASLQLIAARIHEAALAKTESVS